MEQLDAKTEIFDLNFKNETMKIITTPEYYNLVFKDEIYDSEVLDEFQKLTENRDVVIFDVGGFMGISSMTFAQNISENSRVITFEPNPYNIDRIKQNLNLNPHLAKKIQLQEYALSNTKGESNMFLSSNLDMGFSSTSRLNGTHAKIQNQDLPSAFFNHKVKTISLDEYIENTLRDGGGGIMPDIIKVDIEGAEHLFLEGAINLLQTKKPVLFIEFHSEFCTLECSRILFKLGYDIQVLKEEDDNRIMVKAEYVNRSDEMQDLNNQILLNRLRNIEQSCQLMSSKLSNKIDNIHKHNKTFIAENMKEQLLIIDEKINTGVNNIKMFMLTNKCINFRLFLKLLPVNLIPVKSWRKKLKNKIIKKEEKNV